MCYAPGPERDENGIPVYKAPHGEYIKPAHPELIELAKDGYFYPKKNLGVIRQAVSGRLEVVPMRFDMLYQGYVDQPWFKDMTLQEIATKKGSKAVRDKLTGEKWGYDSYNARSETISRRETFKEAWNAGSRGVIPVLRFLERANMKEAPKEFQNREWKIRLAQVFYFGCIWGRVHKAGESLESCSVVTLTSEGHPKIRPIWHERMPVLLTADEALEWLDAETPMTRIKELVKQLGGEWMDLEEHIRPKKAA